MTVLTGQGGSAAQRHPVDVLWAPSTHPSLQVHTYTLSPPHHPVLSTTHILLVLFKVSQQKGLLWEGGQGAFLFVTRQAPSCLRFSQPP